ncbi:hypothetical protein MKK88_27425 [Methylobacterium sp. E-005]|uniref:hypothetical protein n=1 Tax=Methylobacterium sp. E-005 TaxID=2836549 RepID=UPI001FB9036C|nr:hypothetical protein [Methylobacterium sp. E-005]MCJ2089688.1 hypothetical protein [Methylobacterium sp. E-005]
MVALYGASSGVRKIDIRARAMLFSRKPVLHRVSESGGCQAHKRWRAGAMCGIRASHRQRRTYWRADASPTKTLWDD